MPGFSEAGKQLFIAAQLSFAQRKFGFEPTPVERKALAYQYGGLYVAEARGARDGLLAGMAVAFLFTRGRRRPGFVFRALGRLLPLSPDPQACQQQQLLLLTTSKATTFAIISMFGSMCGMTSYGTSAISHLARTQYHDPTVRRYVELRNRWAETRQNESRAGLPHPRYLPSHRGGGGNGEADEQSLGGPDYYGDNGPPAVDAATPPTTPTPAAVAAEDPFFGDDQADRERAQAPAEAGAGVAGPAGSWRNRLQSRAGGAEGGGSAWDQVRKGERSASHPDRRNDRHGDGTGDGGDRSDPPSPPSPWPRRPAMKGFETQQQEQPSSTTKGDSFTFSRSDRDRLLAKEEAQREFDERVERERRGEGLDGFVNET